MALFQLTSDVSIGSFNFSGVHEVRIQRGIKSIEERATIVLPTIAYVQKGKSVQKYTTSTLFSDGDAVNINLGYNGDVNTEFVGFVKRRGTGMPLVVECEGYSRLLRLNVNISGDFRTTPTTAKALLELAVQGTGITVQCDVDFQIKGIKLVKFNGVQICDIVKQVSDHTLSIFFIEPNKLWCGLVYSAYATGNTNAWNFPTINYRLGYNCVRDNGLKERIPVEPVQVIFKGKYATGALLYSASKEKAARSKYTHLSSQINDNTTMGKFAQEKAFMLNYTGYEGRLNSFLQPYATPGMDAYIVNNDLQELNGKYLIEETDVTFGTNGARRVLTIGPRVSFDTANN